jgi:hypothetical protein
MARNGYISRDEAVTRMCALAAVVMEKKFDYTEAADCFCATNPLARSTDMYRFSDAVMRFIELAVRDAIKAGKERRMLLSAKKEHRRG